jgi:enoyl-CoA hydratase/carnithine racemase
LSTSNPPPLHRDFETLQIAETEPGLHRLTLDRPGRLNAMTDTMFAELEEVALGIDSLPEARALVITGAGRGFCAGYDLADAEELPSLGALGMLAQQERAARAMLALRSVRVPVIAAINGSAAGGGFALALACDMRVGSQHARFNAAFVRIGLSAGDLGTSWLLPRLVGPAIASEICFTGRQVESEEAFARGILNRLVPADELLPAAETLAREIMANSPGGVQMSKRALQANMEISSFAAALELENRGQALLTRSADMPEALAAFRERRAPRFAGA